MSTVTIARPPVDLPPDPRAVQSAAALRTVRDVLLENDPYAIVVADGQPLFADDLDTLTLPAAVSVYVEDHHVVDLLARELGLLRLFDYAIGSPAGVKMAVSRGPAATG